MNGVVIITLRDMRSLDYKVDKINKLMVGKFHV